MIESEIYEKIANNKKKTKKEKRNLTDTNRKIRSIHATSGIWERGNMKLEGSGCKRMDYRV